MPELTVIPSSKWLQDPVDALSPAIVISAFDVTHITEAELELKGMKQALQQ